MIENACLNVFARLGNTSFARLPLRLQQPANGRSWTIAWQAANGALVQAGQVLLQITSDSDGQSLRLPSPVPGRLHIRVADSRFVPCTTVVGELQFGIALPLPATPSHTPEVNRLRQESARLNALRRRLRQLRQSLDTLGRELAALRSRRQQLLALKTKLATTSRPALDDCDTARLLETVIARLPPSATPPSAAASVASAGDASLRAALLECARALAGHPVSAGLLNADARNSDPRSLLFQLYEDKIRDVRQAPGVPDDLRDLIGLCWEEVRDLHFHRLTQGP